MIDIGSRLELFVDPFLIDRLDNTALRLHHPQSRNVALTFDRPWEGAFCGYSTVLKDGPRYLLYYRGWPGDESSKRVAAYCVAQSDDGVTFHRSSLGLHEVDGSRDNNIFLYGDEAAHNFSPLIDTRPGVPASERFKALAGWSGRDGDKKVRGLQAWKSADGVRWSLMREQPVITQGAFDSQNVAFWSEHEGCYVSYYRTFHAVPVTQMGGGSRTVSRATSDDFLHWSDPVEMEYGNTPREQLYTNQTHPYFRAPHLYISLPMRFHPERQVLSEQEGRQFGVQMHRERGYWVDVSDGVFMTSRGGNRYDRTFMEGFVRPGRERANWVSRTNMAALNVVPTGDDEMSLYYHHRYAQPAQYLQRYTLRTDGFSSVNAPYAGGSMTTRPLTFAGRELVLNYATSAAGTVRVELLDTAGKPVAGHTLDECDPIIGDEIERVATWKANPDVSKLAGTPVRLRFVMNDADLFSIRFR